jgi:hypothetical protein
MASSKRPYNGSARSSRASPRSTSLCVLKEREAKQYGEGRGGWCWRRGIACRARPAVYGQGVGSRGSIGCVTYGSRTGKPTRGSYLYNLSS